MRVAYITPYFKEEPQVLERCIKSVEAQTIKGDHFLISDGHPQDWVANRVARHIPLGKSHGDYGNTPRGIGAQLAVSEGYDAIGFLDADNWIDPNHTKECLTTAIGNYGSPVNCDYVVARRRFVRPDMTVLNMPDDSSLIDTSCFFFLRGAFPMLPTWNLMPKEFSNIGDRIFGKRIREAGLNSATNKAVTVNYLNLWASSYHAMHETPPPEAKPNVDGGSGYRWLAEMDSRNKELVHRLVGSDL